MGRKLFLILPAAAGAALMAWSIHQSQFVSDTRAASLVWAMVLLAPFVCLGAMAWRSRQGWVQALMVVVPELLLAALPFVCLNEGFGEGSQFLLLFSPLYLWGVVAIAVLLEIATRQSAAGAR